MITAKFLFGVLNDKTVYQDKFEHTILHALAADGSFHAYNPVQIVNDKGEPFLFLYILDQVHQEIAQQEIRDLIDKEAQDASPARTKYSY